MATFIDFLNTSANVFVEFASSMLIQSSILIIALLLLDYILRRRVRAILRYCIWMLVLAKLVLPTSLSLPTGVGYWFGDKLSFSVMERTSNPTDSAMATETHVQQVLPQQELPANITHQPLLSGTGEPRETTAAPVAHPPVISETQSISLTWHAYVLSGWFAILAVMVLFLVQRFVFVKRLIQQAGNVDVEILKIFAQCRKDMGVTREINLKYSSVTASPVVCGLFKPTILIPVNSSREFDSQHLRSILLHELAHVKRGDLPIGFLQTVLQIFYFYNPLLWLANSIIRNVREQAVDEMVLVAMGEDAGDYPETLLHVSRMAFSKPALSLRLIGVIESKKALSTRIKHILSRPFPKSSKLGIAGLVALFIAAAVLLPMANGAGYVGSDFSAGRELSSVSGISLIKNKKRGQSSSSRSSSSDHSHSRQSIKSETLPVILKRISKDYPVKFEAKLPKGYYDLNAHVDGSERILLEEVCSVFSQSFALDVCIKSYKQRVMVLSCADPAKIKLKRSNRDLSCGFYKQEQNEDNTLTEKFITDMDGLVNFARRHFLEKSSYKYTLINETDLEGLYEGTLKWSMENNKILIESLKDMGFKISKAKREVEGVVVSNGDPDRDYTKQRLSHPLNPELVIQVHKYHQEGQEFTFTISSKPPIQEKIDEMPNMVFVFDGKKYSTNMKINPYSSGEYKFTDNIFRGKNKPELIVGKHTAYVSLKDFDLSFRGQKRHVEELRSNEIEFEIVKKIPDGYFNEVKIENGKKVLDDCHIKMLYLVTPSSDNQKEYTEIITVKGYTPPFNIAAKTYLESESGKKVFLQDLAVVSRVGEVLSNNSFSHSIHTDFNRGKSILNQEELLREKWRVVLEPSTEVARKNPSVKSYYGQKYFGPYQNIQMEAESFRFRDAGFTHKSSIGLSNFQGFTGTIDMDTCSMIGDINDAELKFDKNRNVFQVLRGNGIAAIKLKKTYLLDNLEEQMIQAVDKLLSGKGNVETIEIRDDELEMYAIRSSQWNYFLLSVNGVEHNQNGFHKSSNIEYSSFSYESQAVLRQAKSIERE